MLIVSKEKLRNSNLVGYMRTYGEKDEEFKEGCIKCCFISSVIGYRNLNNWEMEKAYDVLASACFKDNLPSGASTWEKEEPNLFSVLHEYEHELGNLVIGRRSMMDLGIGKANNPEHLKILKEFKERFISELEEKKLVIWEEDLCLTSEDTTKMTPVVL